VLSVPGSWGEAATTLELVAGNGVRTVPMVIFQPEKHVCSIATISTDGSTQPTADFITSIIIAPPSAHLSWD
jgi:hypothetical protein